MGFVALKVYIISVGKTQHSAIESKVNVKKVKVSRSLIAVGAVEVRVPLYLGHR